MVYSLKNDLSIFEKFSTFSNVDNMTQIQLNSTVKISCEKLTTVEESQHYYKCMRNTNNIRQKFINKIERSENSFFIGKFQK